MGPYVMAGLTHDTRGIKLPAVAEDAQPSMSVPSSTGYVSIFGLDNRVDDVCNAFDGACGEYQVRMATLNGQAQFLKLDRRHVVATNTIANSGQGNDATFRITTPYTR